MDTTFVLEPITDAIRAAEDALWEALAPELMNKDHLVVRLARHPAAGDVPETFVVFLDWPNAVPPPNSRLTCNFFVMRHLIDQLPAETAVCHVQTMLKEALKSMDEALAKHRSLPDSKGP